MVEEIDFQNVRILDSQGLMTLTLDRVIGMAYRHASYLHTKFHSNQKTFYALTDGCTPWSLI